MSILNLLIRLVVGLIVGVIVYQVALYFYLVSPLPGLFGFVAFLLVVLSTWDLVRR